MDWIKISDHLPEVNGERVLITIEDVCQPDRQPTRYVIEATYRESDKTFRWYDLEIGESTVPYVGKVIAWMPYPDPYYNEMEEL